MGEFDYGSFKASETLLGIETSVTSSAVSIKEGFKASETLLGIETFSLYKNLA